MRQQRAGSGAMEPDLMGLVVLLGSTVLLAVVSRVVIRMGAEGTMGPNWNMGIRTRHTTVCEEAWQAGHAAALPVARWTGWVALGALAIGVPVGVRADSGWGIAGGLAGLLAVAAVLFRASQAANRAARAVTAEQKDDGGGPVG